MKLGLNFLKKESTIFLIDIVEINKFCTISDFEIQFKTNEDRIIIIFQNREILNSIVKSETTYDITHYSKESFIRSIFTKELDIL